MKDKKWARLLAYVTGTVNQELLLQNEYLAAKNLNLRGRLPSRLRLSDPERATLAEIGKRLGRHALRKVACIAKSDTILAWYRRLIARKFDGSQHRPYPGRPRVEPKLEALVVRMARENSGWGSARSPNLNAFAERWVRSAKEECLSKLIPFGERPLTRTLAEFSAHYRGERNHQGKSNKLLFPEAGDEPLPRGHPVECRQRLGGLLKYYGRAA